MGIKSLFDFIKKHLLKVIWQSLKDGWQGALHLKTSHIQTSSMFNDSRLSMKQIFRTVLRKKIKLLDLNNFEQNK